MHPLSAAELLTLWEQGLAQPPYERALSLLARACPETSADALARLSIGQRDNLLLTLREWTFGSQLPGSAACPNCREALDVMFDAAEIRAEPSTPVEHVELAYADFQVQFRLPNSLDLAAISQLQETDSRRQQLLDRCLVKIERASQPVQSSDLPPELLDGISEQMARADPQADVELALNCPNCGHAWHVSFDIVSFFWAEINAWAWRLLLEIHHLASRYGWRESDILALSPWRRKVYLDMIGV